MTATETKHIVDTELQKGVIHLDRGSDGIAILRLGASTEKVITLTERRLDSLKEILLRLQDDTSLRGLIVTGPCEEMFAVGADISLIQALEQREDGERAAAKGQSIFALFEKLKIPVVGAIEGPCLGGGLEMALGFDVRVASDHPSTLIGLPEVKLGIVPGFGGTQRLPRLVGLPKALDLILKGKMLKPALALRAGVVDRVVSSERLVATAHQEVEGLVRKGTKRPRRQLRGSAHWLSRVGFLRAFVRRKVMKTLRHGQARFYDAPRVALELCVDAFGLAREEGFAKEASELGKLIVSPTCKALVRLYFLTERSKKLGKQDGGKVVSRAQILGGGAMGGGIGGLLANKGLRVRLSDLSTDCLTAAKKRLQKNVSKLLKRRRIKRHQAVAIQDRMAVGTNWGDLSQVDLFLEAVVEDLDVKKKLFAQAVEAGLSDDAIIASNTSSLPLDKMAEGLPNPGRVVGMHFFNPPEVMPLVEVIVGRNTSDQATATICDLAFRLGKFPVVVKDSPGFLVNRCLAPYLNEAARMMVEGCSPTRLDRVMLDFGLPMGPARLMDEVGFDVAGKVSEVLSAAFPDRMEPCELFASMVRAGHLGNKSGGGIYSRGGREVLAMIQTDKSGELSPAEIRHRLLYPMVDEAYRCLAEGIVESEEDLDLALVMGIGFPPFTGGITEFARREGLDAVLSRLEKLASTHGPRFVPGPELRRRAHC